MEDMEKIERLRAAKGYAKILTSKAYQDYQMANEVTKKLYEELERQRTNYEDIDRELAEIDGRLTVLPTNMPGKEKKVEALSLTIDQIISIAEKVGIKLDLEEEYDFD